jgi:hypothetical protein
MRQQTSTSCGRNLPVLQIVAAVQPVAGSFVSAAGERGRERARRAAAEYAAVIASVGIDTDEAIRIVQAALTKGIAVSPSP